MSDLKQCPFEVTHLIEGKSFAMHIVKCQRQHPDIKLARCHLDTSHLMREEELQQHMKTCTSRGQLDAYKYSLMTGAASRVSSLPDPADDLIINTTEPIIRRGGGGAGGGSGRGRGGGRGGTTSTTVGQTLLDDTECWDDSDCKAYDPLESCRAKKNENAAFITPKINQFVEQRTAAAVLKNDSGTKREQTSDEEFGSSALNERQNDLEQFGLRRNASHGANAARVVSGRYGEMKQEPGSSGSRERDDRHSGERSNSRSGYEAGERNPYSRRSDSGGYHDRERHGYDRRSDGYSNRDRYDSRHRRDGYDSESRSSRGYGRNDDDGSRNRGHGNDRYQPYGGSSYRSHRTSDSTERGSDYSAKYPNQERDH
ncbi:TATA-binding protein-associated factor 2N-like [Anopheles arabiensis]|uniref:CHHC U11-48K-type domain-containing protein n=1 Tax=Anopheles arabiensis TaxID=7173 RepID=A0A2C9GR07_ANOAR|nr:TATA-binding protein-associated factor 2N-like [Anopheles arabiensis]